MEERTKRAQDKVYRESGLLGWMHVLKDLAREALADARSGKGLFEVMVDDLRERFPQNGSFTLIRGEKLSTASRGTPDEAGVYLIYSLKAGERELIYIGKAGTLRQDGTMKDQRLRGRINAAHGNISRARFFAEQITHLGLEALEFHWFVTYGDAVKIPPAKAEADLIQTYFDEYKRLPLWNESF